MNEKNLRGKVFGRLTVIDRLPEKDRWGRCWMWRCRCECGKECAVSTGALIGGSTKSCGCLVLEQAAAAREGHEYADGTSVSLIKSKTVYSTNSSGVRGVSWRDDCKKWQARITFRRKTYSLGLFDSLQAAKRAREEAERRIYGDFLEWYAIARNEADEKNS